MANETSARADGAQDGRGIETPVVVGTAGHVDHGKSALVMRLTGVDPDRLPQEKERGITIDLGFAELRLPSGRVVGLVDVPGHGHYVRAMVSGATGVDVALLVVAADDGVMPQTREHVRILELLGVRHMVVALTKVDLVDEDWLELACADVEEYVASTAFAGAPVIAVSSRTGVGIDRLAAELDRQVDAFLSSDVSRRRREQPARLPVDRVFTVAGAGTVVTGTTSAGAFAPGDEVEISPAGARARVRGVQVHGHPVDRAVAGQRTALNVVGAPDGAIVRGCTIAAPGSLHARDRFDARLTWLGRDGVAEALKSGQRVHVCTKTSQSVARVLLFDGAQELQAGQEALVQVRLDEPLALRSHDPFVVMSYSPVELVGGGEVLLTRVPRRSALTGADRRLLEAVCHGDHDEACSLLVADARAPMSAAEVADALDLPVDTCVRALEGDASRGEEARVVRLPARPGMETRYVGRQTLDELVERMAGSLAGLPKGDWGVPALTLRDSACPWVGDEPFAALVYVAIARGRVARYDTALTTPERAQELRRRSGDLLDRVGSALSERGLAAPMVDELAAQLELPVADLQRALRGLASQGRAEQIDKTYYLDSRAAEQAREVVRRTIEQGGGSATASELRSALGISRKYAMPLLEHLDQVGFTARDAADPNRRILRRG
ncbi:MAG: selenocysteine-specific translation elongation factor [Coriobacteriales bacterium]|jgi:selenocysteine-specific elongation factor